MRIKTRSLFTVVFLLSLLFLTLKILLNNNFDLEARNDISHLIVQKFDPALGVAQPLRDDVVIEAKNLEESPVKIPFVDLDNKVAFDKPDFMVEQKQEPIKQKPVKTYLDLNKCSVQYETASKANEANGLLYNYSLPADETLQSQTIIRGVMFFFQRSNAAQFMPEFKWLYRSWIESVRNSPKAWQTDLIVFVDLKDYKNDPIFTVFEEFGCYINKPRVTKTDKSMCILIDFISMRERITEQVIENPDTLFQHFYNEADPFSDDPRDLRKLYALLSHLRNYDYTDSILMAFDGYKYLKDSYDFLIRTDLDIFLTPLFGKWLPRHCNDFIVGNGGYSTDFNTRRMGRIANNLGLNYADKSGLGSTWYSTPRQFRIVSYFTLISMVYISSYEFTESERMAQIGTLNWPDWHYVSIKCIKFVYTYY
jgi:hypothetical protein